MRKLRIVFVLALFAFLWSVPAFTGTASAATVSHASAQPTGASHHGSSVIPFSSGGGCSGFVKTASNDPFFEIASCISGDHLFAQNEVTPDAYAYFGASSPGLWSDCHITISGVLASTNKTIASTSSSCLNEARVNGSNDHYWYTGSCGPSSNELCANSGSSYYTYACATGTYNGKFLQVCARSPNESI